MEWSCPCGREFTRTCSSIMSAAFFTGWLGSCREADAGSCHALLAAQLCLCHHLWQYLQPSFSSPSCSKAWYLTLLFLLLQAKSKQSSDSKEKSQKERTNITRMGGPGEQPGKGNTMVTRPTHCPWCCHGAVVTENLGKTLRAQRFPSASMQGAQPTQS